MFSESFISYRDSSLVVAANFFLEDNYEFRADLVILYVGGLLLESYAIVIGRCLTRVGSLIMLPPLKTRVTVIVL